MPHADLAALVVLYTAPVAVGGLTAGWALDRFDRRRLMIADSVVRAAVFASIPITVAVAQVTAIQLYAVAAIYGLLKMINLAGFPTLIPSLVPENQLEQANALESASFGLASLTGAAAAGLGVATIGAIQVMAIDAATYLVLAASLLSVPQLSPKPHTSPTASGSAAIGVGFMAVVRMVVYNPVLRNTTIMFALFNVGEGTLLVFLPYRAVDLGLGVSGYGYLVAASTGGELVGAAFLASRRWNVPLRKSIVGAQLFAATIVGALIIDSIAVTVCALVAVGMAGSSMTTWAQTLRMRLAPAESHGRLFALLRTTMQATPPVGAGLATLTMTHGTNLTVIAVVAVIGLPAALLGRGLTRAQVANDADHLKTPAISAVAQATSDPTTKEDQADA